MEGYDANDPELINKLEFVDHQEKVYFAKAQLGEQVRLFLVSPVGRYLHARAKQDYEEAKEEMVGANPDSLFGRRKLKKLQQKAEKASMFMRYLSDAIIEAEDASKHLTEQ